MVERPVETRQEEIRALLGPHEHADVAQWGEARRSERRECRFESDRQYQLDEAQSVAHRFREPGVESSSLSVQTMRGGEIGITPGSEPGVPRSNRGLVAIDASVQRSACCVVGASFNDPQVAGSTPAVLRDVAQSAEQWKACSGARVLRPISLPVSCEGWAFFLVQEAFRPAVRIGVLLHRVP